MEGFHRMDENRRVFKYLLRHCKNLERLGVNRWISYWPFIYSVMAHVLMIVLSPTRVKSYVAQNRLKMCSDEDCLLMKMYWGLFMVVIHFSQSSEPLQRALVVAFRVPVGAYQCLYVCYFWSAIGICHFTTFVSALWSLMDEDTFISSAIFFT